MSSFADKTGAIVVVLTTAPDAETAARLARKLVELRLVACVNLIPGIRSIYRWKDEIRDDAEVLMVMKTRQELGESVRAWIKANHPYEVPEAIEIPISGGLADYLQWVIEATS